ncbi:DUF2849 domain-containing protein [Novispirillum itersonii]|uniref:DUF2849 domain-containing protein n=1 Tax=Novispirillum itersonii TaxID=189 RepID=A0A7W9ZEA2_NOVIT|nr:DUF2849 domain-containing protein [Novispirillum itersonii]MBB6209548.1 hypothetical protein [Novispirillum itersonii]
MSRQIVSANRLTDGLVVFRTAAGTWSERVEDARVYTAEDAEIEVAAASREATVVVGAYAVDLEEQGSAPSRLRERIRATGPTIAYGPAAVITPRRAAGA